MTLAKVCSGLIGLGLALSGSIAQQPPGKDEKPQPQQAPQPKAQPNELEAAIAASATHPDVRLAQAKLQMAQAELDQAKLLVVQRLTVAYVKLQSAKTQVQINEDNYSKIKNLGGVPWTEKRQHEVALAQAKAALAASEAEWNAARGQAPGQHAALTREAVAYDTAYWTANTVARLLASQHGHQPTERAALTAMLNQGTRSIVPEPGSAAYKLGGLIEKPVKLGESERVTFDKALDELVKQAGLTDLTIRKPEWISSKNLKGSVTAVGPLQGEQTIIGWFQLIVDDLNRTLANLPQFDPPIAEELRDIKRARYEVYVRDYGLLITTPELAPPGALTLAEFARQLKAQKDVPKPEPKK